MNFAGKQPYISIRVVESNGKYDGPIDLENRIVSFTHKDKDKGADTFTLILDNHDLSLFDDARLASGQKVEVSWGYENAMTIPEVFTLYKPKGWSKLRIEGRGKAYAMNMRVKRRLWDNMSYSQIATQIATEEKFDDEFLFIDDSNQILESVQQYESNAKFLTRIAGKIGYVFSVDRMGFHFHRRRLDNPPDAVYSWGFEVKTSAATGQIMGEPNFESNQSRKNPGLIRYVGIDEETGEEYEVKGSNEDTDRSGLGESLESGNPETSNDNTPQGRLASEMVRYTAAKNEAEAKREVDGAYFHRSTDRATLKFSAIGHPAIRARALIDFWCQSQYVSGRWYVKEITSTIAQGSYTQSFDLSRDAGRKSPIEIPLPEINVDLEISPLDSTGTENIQPEDIEQTGQSAEKSKAKINIEPTKNSKETTIVKVESQDANGDAVDDIEFQYPDVVYDPENIDGDDAANIAGGFVIGGLF